MRETEGAVGHGRRGMRSVVVAGFVVAVALLAACAPPAALVSESAAPADGDGSQGSSIEARPRRCELPADSSTQPDKASPAEVGMDAAAVRNAVEYASARGAQSVRIYRHGCLVARSGNDPAIEWVPVPIWSMTKGIVSLIVGRAVELGHLDVTDRVGDHLDWVTGAHRDITLHQLLTQTSGLRFAWANDLHAATDDSVAELFTRPFEAEPGSRFIYAQTTITAIVAMVEAAVGEDIQSFADRELFAPIGIKRSEWKWERDGSGRTHGFAGITMTPRSVARVGLLMNDGGVWNGRRLIGTDYATAMLQGSEDNPSYGYLWMTNNGDAYRAVGYTPEDRHERNWIPAMPRDGFGLSGMFNQNVFVIPSFDMVVVRIGQMQELFPDPYGLFEGRTPSWDHHFFRTLLNGVSDVDYVDPGPWKPDEDVPVVDLEHIVWLPIDRLGS